MQLLRRHVRGRPPHPDVLTPAEWRVLERLRAGESNAAIAARLGVSVNTVRTHVSSMLAKLELRDRGQLAEWEGEPAAATKAALRRGRPTLLATPLGWLRESAAMLKPAGVIAGAAMIGVALVGGAYAASRLRTDERAAPAPVSFTPEAKLTEVATVRLGSPVVIDGEFLVVVLPQTQGSRPPHLIERVGIEGGIIRSQEASLDPRDYSPVAYLNTWRNIHYPPRAASDVLLATICLEGACVIDGPGDPDSRTALVRSEDKGLTWDTVAAFEGPLIVRSWNTTGTEALLWKVPTSPGALQSNDFVLWPSLEAAGPPASTYRPMLDRPPMFLVDGRLGWWADDGLIDDSGRLVLDFAVLGEAAVDVVEAALSPDGRRLLLTWSPTSVQRSPWRWTLFELDGSGTYASIRTLVAPADVFNAVPYCWLDDHQVVIPAGARPESLGFAPGLRVGYLPAVLDFDTDTLSAIAGFEAAGVVERGNLVIWADLR